MLAAVSGLTFLLSTLLKLDNSLGYLLPLPIAVAALRSGVGAAWKTMLATSCLLIGGRAGVGAGAGRGARGGLSRTPQRARLAGWLAGWPGSARL
jgi:hypothetical protein